MYKLLKNIILNKVTCVQRLSDNAYIPFDPANTDYAKFKDAVNAGKAQLQDADGKTMTAEQAKQFVKELP
jgi:hypothetical protein